MNGWYAQETAFHGELLGILLPVTAKEKFSLFSQCCHGRSQDDKGNKCGGFVFAEIHDEICLPI